MTENLHSYIVCLNFAAPGILIVGCYIAPDEASAAALATLEAAKKMQGLDPLPPLMNCMVSEESAENLRHRLRIIEGGKPGGEVVSLVPRDPPASAPYTFPPAWLDGKFTLYGEEFGPLPPVA